MVPKRRRGLFKKYFLWFGRRERTLCGTFSLEDHPLILGKEGKSRLVFYEYIFILLRRRRHITTHTHRDAPSKKNHHGAAERIRSSRAHDSGRLVSSSASIAFRVFCSDARRTGAAIATDERECLNVVLSTFGRHFKCKRRARRRIDSEDDSSRKMDKKRTKTFFSSSRLDETESWTADRCAADARA